MKQTSLAVCLLTDDTRYGFSMHSLLAALRPQTHFHLCRSEEELVLYMKGVGIYADRQTYPIPNLLLLDSHHPHSHDLFVLQWIREESRFRHIPVIILAELKSPLLKKCFDLGANACAVIRTDLNSVCEIIDGVSDLQGILASSASKGVQSANILNH
jgi:CheY-like chemotaxis protein